MRPGLDEGEASRSQDAVALLALLEQLLQGLHVEHVTVIHLLLNGLWVLGPRGGAVDCRVGGHRSGRDLGCTQLIAAFFP